MDYDPPDPSGPPGGAAGKLRVPTLAEERKLPTRPQNVGPKVERMKSVFANPEELNKVAAKAEGRLFFDYSSPSVKKRRETARAIWEEYAERRLQKTNLTQDELFNADTCVDFTWSIIMHLGEHTPGVTAERAKAGTLFQFKEAIYWWLVRVIPTFSTIFQLWNTIALNGISRATLDFNLSKEWLPKNELSDAELELLWSHVQEHATDNLKQHYVAWILVYILSVRPGSFTVCPGYQKGARLPNGETLKVHETLYWSDLEFINLGNGEVCVSIVFRFNKGMRGSALQAQRTREGLRKFRLMPIRSSRYHLDLTLLLIGLAMSRGLFDCPADQIFSGQRRTIRQKPEISSQAVFVSGTQKAGVVKPEDPMREYALNAVLRETCTAVGLFQRNTMYSLRRTAIIETRRKGGTELAKELAGHAQGSDTIFAYDYQALADLDVTNDRLDLTTYSRASMRKMFAQVNDIPRFTREDIGAEGSTATSSSETLLGAIRKQALERSRLDPEWLAHDGKLEQHRADIRDHLTGPSHGIDIVHLRVDRDLEDALKTHRPKDLECAEMHDKLKGLHAEARAIRRRLQRRLVKIVKQENLAKAKADLSVFKAKSGTGGNLEGTRGSILGAELDHLPGDRSAERAAVAAAEAQIQALEAIQEKEDGDGDDGEEGDDLTQEEDDPADHGRDEPKEWEVFGDVGEVQVEANIEADVQAPTLAGRLAFVNRFADLTAIPTSNLACLLCQLDDTITYEDKETTYTKSKLRRHLIGPTHRRAEQLTRAFRIDMDVEECATCPICGEVFKGPKKFIAHCEEEHEDQMEF